MDKVLIEKVRMTVSALFKEKYDMRSTYHSFGHTKEVAEAAEKIGKAAGLNNVEMEVVLIAAWFHDTGYLIDKQNHEEHSAQFAEEFLRGNHFPESKIQLVKDNILATEINHIPGNLMEEVLHDADYINLASPDNLMQSELLRDEIVNYGGKKPTEEEWLTSELKFLLNHRYYTSYSRNKLEEKKSENIKKIKKKLKNYRKDEAFILNTPSTEQLEKSMNDSSQEKNGMARSNGAVYKEANTKTRNEDMKPEGKKKEDKKEIKKAVEEQKNLEKKEAIAIKEFDTIYRLVATNHMRMNAIADRKANIMLSLNAIIISLTMGIVASSSEYTLRFIIPTSILIVVCLITIVFAALSTRPKVTSGKVEKQDIEDKKANLLFFGNFSKMEFKDFDWGIRKLLVDQEYLHNSMFIDFYTLGTVLHTKYKFLRICYNVFMFGIVIAVLAIPVLIILGY